MSGNFDRRKKRRNLIAENAVFGVHILAIDSLQAPETAGRRARRQGCPRCGTLRRAHTLFAIHVQSAQRAQGRIRARRTEGRHAIVVV